MSLSVALPLLPHHVTIIVLPCWMLSWNSLGTLLRYLLTQNHLRSKHTNWFFVGNNSNLFNKQGRFIAHVTRSSVLVVLRHGLTSALDQFLCGSIISVLLHVLDLSSSSFPSQSQNVASSTQAYILPHSL